MLISGNEFIADFALNFAVFSCYKMPQANETELRKTSNDVDSYRHEIQTGANSLASDNSDDNSISVKSNLLKAEQRIKELESRLHELEKRLPVKFEEVNFLNFSKKKRILVRCSLVSDSYQLKLILYD